MKLYRPMGLTRLWTALLFVLFNLTALAQNPFITTWKTDNNGPSEDNQISVPATGDFNYIWENVANPAETGSGSGSGPTTIAFPQAGTYKLSIQPTGSTPFDKIEFYQVSADDKLKILAINNWGTIPWSGFKFNGSSNLKITATDIPDLSGVTDLSFAFSYSGIESIPNINDWDVSTVTKLGSFLQQVTGFNQSLSNWDVSKVTDMSFMFDGATSFNQPLDSWDVSSLEQFDYMFRNASSFNQSLGAWNLASLVGGVGVFFNSGLSCENYSYTLYGWATNPNTKEGVLFNPWAPMQYSPDVVPYRDFLINELGWEEFYGDALGMCSITLPGLITPGDPGNFITTWKTDNPSESEDNQITIPIHPDGGYNFTIAWGDGSQTTWKEGDAAEELTHTYAVPGTYIVEIIGDFPRIFFNGAGDRQKILAIEQWGDIAWSSMEDAFNGAINVMGNATDVPDLSSVTSLARMFWSAGVFNGDIGNWDVSGITNMAGMFTGANRFNQDIGSWVVSNVTNMDGMFVNAHAFNQDISSWQVGNVTNMISMFRNASEFNQDISRWDVAKVTIMQRMFFNTPAFDVNLGNWDVSKVTDMVEMLSNSGLSRDNYDATLIGWAGQALQNDVTLGADGLEYCASTRERQSLIDDHGWTITGDVQAADCDGAVVTPDDNNILYVDINVDTDATGYTGAGDSWTNAIPQLADALKWANDNKANWTNTSPLLIYVAKGNYKPQYKVAEVDDQNNPTTDRDKSFLMVPDVQLYGGFDPENGITTLDDDRELPSSGGSVLSGDIGTENNNADNTYHVVLSAGAVGTALLDGFTITGGNADGGLVYIRVNTKNIWLDSGGGMYNDSSSPVLTNVIISGNTASDYGGGIVNAYSASPVLTNVIISGNTTGGYGGGMDNSYSASPVLTNVTISGNTAVHGGGIFNMESSAPVLTNVTISGNTATHGGGIFSRESAPVLTNVTISGNRADDGESGVMYNDLSSSPIIRNSIIYNNNAGIKNTDASSSPSISYSLAQGINSTVDGNIDGSTDPLFTDVANGDYTLQAVSPVIDAGSNALFAGLDANTKDLAGNLRLVGTMIDMGAYEFQGDAGTGVTPDADNILYVDINVNTTATDYTGAGDSWENAIPQLADALQWAREQHDGGSPGWTEAEPLRIFVAKGKYKPLYNAADGAYTTDGGRDNSFVLVPNVQLYGGFDPLAGIKALEDARILPDREADAMAGTVLNGDLNGDDAADIPVMDLHSHASRQDNAHHVVLAAGEVGTARLDGFAITGGNAAGAAVGVPILQVNSSPIYNDDNGGGISTHYSSPTISHIVLTGNSAEDTGGGMDSYRLPAPKLNHVVFSGNSARAGGGMSTNESSPALTNVIFAGNGAETGGGIAVGLSSPKLSNVTITGNSADNGGGMVIVESSATITNMIIWGNEASGSTTSVAASIYKAGLPDPRPTISHSLIANLGGSENWDEELGIDGGGNIDADPVFVSTTPGEAGYLQLAACSPAISVGNNQAYTDADGDLTNDLDLAGNPRVYNATGGGVIDMGAFEYQGERVLIQSLTIRDAVQVPYGTALEDVAGLPTAVTATLSDDTDVSIPLDGNLANWILATPADGAYNGDVAGTYVFTVPLLIPETEYFLNPENLQAEVIIVVAKGTPVLTASWNGEAIDATEGISLTYGDVGELLLSTTDTDGVVTYALGNDDTPVLELADLSAVAAQQAGTATLTIAQEETDNYEAASMAFNVSVAPKAITIVPIAGQGKIYGADEPAAYGYELAEGDALAFNDELTDIVSVVSREVGEDVGAYDVTFTVEGEQAGSYAITITTDNDAFMITPREITVTAANKTKVYGADDPELTYTFTPELIGDDILTGSLDRDAGEAVGNYAITQGDLSAGANYAITFESGELTVTPGEYEDITLNDLSFTYDGTEHALTLTGDLPVGASVVYEIDGETGNGATDAGTYEIIALIDGGANYQDLELTALLTIVPLEITVTAVDKTKVFGADDPALTYTFMPELIGDDIFTGSLDRDAGEAVGNYAITQGDLSAGANYAITFESGELTVTPGEYEDITLNDLSFTYDGTEHALTLTGDLPVGASVVYEIDGETGNGATDAGTYEVKALIEGGANYVDTELTATLTITPLTVTVTAEDQTKVFGTDDPVLTYTFTPELIVNDDFIGALIREEGETVGTYLITQGNLSAGNNYTIVLEVGLLTITASTITGITFEDNSFLYDGIAKSLAITGTPPAGTRVNYTDNGRTDVGTQVVTATISGSNYTELVLTADLTIMPATVTGITFGDGSFVYDGTAKSLAISGALPTGTAVAYTNNSRTDVGRQVVTATITGSNYTELVLTADLAITRATITGITFVDATFTYDGTAKSIEIGGTLPSGVTVVYTDNEKTNAGSYTVEADVNGGNNYTSQSLTAQLLINKASQTITFSSPGELSRDAGTVVLDVWSSSDLPVSLSVDDTFIATVSGTDLEVHRLGTVRVTAIQSGDANHEAADPVTIDIKIANDASAKVPVRVHQAVSPNGDGINEFLMIEGIGDYPDNRVTIFDKSGRVLAEIEGYNNRDKVFTGQDVIDATYYYYLDLRVDGTLKREKGFFVVKRSVGN